MSVLGILLHFSRAVIHAHSNAKVRNLMGAMPPRTHAEAVEEEPDTGRQESLLRQRRGWRLR